MSTPFDQALRSIVEIFQFEHWLRFYFIVEEEIGLVMRLPDKAMTQINKAHAHLAELAQSLNNKPMSPEISQNAIGEFILKTIEGIHADQNLVPSVLNSRKFQAELHLFNLWIDANESQLESSFLDFSTWMQIYGTWKTSDKAKQFYASLITADTRTGSKKEQ